MARPGIMLYFDLVQPLKLLSYEEKGRLLDAMLEYGEYGTLPKFEGMLALAWSFILPRIERDSKRYESIVEKRTQAAKARWAKEGKPASDANGCTCISDMPTTITSPDTKTITSASTTQRQPQQQRQSQQGGCGDFEQKRQEAIAKVAGYRGGG